MLAIASIIWLAGQSLAIEQQPAQVHQVGAIQSPWKRRDADQWDLWLEGKHVGSYRTSSDKYWPALSDGRYGDHETPPVAVPREAWPTKESWRKIHGVADAKVITGVVSEKIDGPAYSTNSGVLSRQQAFDRINRASSSLLRDDTGRIWATVIGSDSARKPVEEYLKNHASKERIVSNGFVRDDWQVDPAKFGALPAGDPVILIQGKARPDGTAFAYWLQTSGDLRNVERGLTEALRKADPNWRPDKVPGPNGGGSMTWTETAVVALLFICFLLAVLLLILFLVFLFLGRSPDSDGGAS